jgi:hypothetical protein
MLLYLLRAVCTVCILTCKQKEIMTEIDLKLNTREVILI